jgi:hypothetical protein
MELSWELHFKVVGNVFFNKPIVDNLICAHPFLTILIGTIPFAIIFLYNVVIDWAKRNLNKD